MKPPAPLLLALATLLIPTSAPAAETLTETEKKSVLEKLDSLLNRREAGVTSGAKIAIPKLKAAAASDSAAIALYVASVKMERFERDERKDEFSDWKKKHTDVLRKDAPGASLRAHTFGLAVALEVARADSLPSDTRNSAFLALLPEINTFLDLMLAAEAHNHALKRNKKDIFSGSYRGGEQLDEMVKIAEDIFKKDIFKSEIANAFNITAYIQPPKNFPTSLGDALDATESFLLPRLYEIEELPPIDEAWNRHIKRLAEAVNYYKDEKLIARSKDLFEEKLPLARWAQARDRYNYGSDKVAGATAMLEVIKTHLDHEFCVTWIEEFKDLVEKPPETGETAGL